MRRTLYEDDHESYRLTVRAFLANEVCPSVERWETERLIDRAIFPIAAKYGIYALEVPELYGGMGLTDYRYRMVVNEEIARIHATSFGVTLGLQDDLVLHYLIGLCNEEQRQRWLPKFARGSVIGALAMTEPDAGSDLRGIRTTAIRDGEDWVLNGQKTFISSGTSADLLIVAAQSGETTGKPQLSLFVVTRDMPGFTHGRKLDKMGLHGQDTSELFFDNVRVPSANLLGAQGRGLAQLMIHLPRERLGVASSTITSARAIFELTRAYCFQRKTFGQLIGDFQNTRFVLAEMATELDVTEAYVDQCVLAYNVGELTPVDAAKVKWWASELQKRVIDRCVQLHGGYGYMMEYPVARAYVDSRVQTIFAGTTEIMKEIIGRSMGA